MEVRELTDQDHEVLGAEYCSGYTDIYGKWNTGFDCPTLGNGETVYCCGTVTSKYCCTKRDQQTSTGLSQAVVLGAALGSVLVFILVSVVSCLVYRRCVPYRRAHTSLSGGPLYSMQCSSTASGVANMYSFSGQNSVATTPHDTVSDPHHIVVDLDASQDASASTQHRPFVPHRGFGQLPSDPPPPYNDADHQIRDSSVISHTTTSFTPHSPSGHVSQATPTARQQQQQQQQLPSCLNNIIKSQDTLYWSTKF